MKPKWKEGNPKAAGCPGFFWVIDEDGEREIVEVDLDGNYRRRHTGKTVAYSGPIEEPDEETLP
jgi:hypothetical protein